MKSVNDFPIDVFRVSASSPSIESANSRYCCGGGGGAGTAFFVLCRRGLAFIAAPLVVNVTCCGSPGTLVNVKLLPARFARNDIARGVPSSITVTAV